MHEHSRKQLIVVDAGKCNKSGIIFFFFYILISSHETDLGFFLPFYILYAAGFSIWIALRLYIYHMWMYA